MLPLLLSRLRLPSRGEAALIGGCAVALLFASWLRRGERIATLEAFIAARPLISESAKRATDLKRGPVKVSRKTTILPDGTKTVESVREVASEERHTASETARVETPACPAPRRPKTRYGHITLDPGASLTPRAADAGLTLWDRLDVGGSYDWRYKALGIEVGGRF